jgi:hypothetical protein
MARKPSKRPKAKAAVKPTQARASSLTQDEIRRRNQRKAGIRRLGGRAVI